MNKIIDLTIPNRCGPKLLFVICFYVILILEFENHNDLWIVRCFALVVCNNNGFEQLQYYIKLKQNKSVVHSGSATNRWPKSICCSSSTNKYVSGMVVLHRFDVLFVFPAFWPSKCTPKSIAKSMELLVLCKICNVLCIPWCCQFRRKLHHQNQFPTWSNHRNS